MAERLTIWSSAASFLDTVGDKYAKVSQALREHESRVVALFCDPEDPRFDLGEAFVRNGWKVATDGRIFLGCRTTALNDDKVVPGVERFIKFASEKLTDPKSAERLQVFDRDHFRAMKYRPGEHDDPIDVIATEIDGVELPRTICFAPDYFEMICQLPATSFAVLPLGEHSKAPPGDVALFFTSGIGGIGCLMPMGEFVEDWNYVDPEPNVCLWKSKAWNDETTIDIVTETQCGEMTSIDVDCRFCPFCGLLVMRIATDE